MQIPAPPEISNGLCTYRPRGKHSLVEAVALVSNAISYCRERGVSRHLIDVTGLTDLPIPTLVDRFLMVEEWAQVANGTTVVAMVGPSEYIHPQKFGVEVALHFGLICDVFSSEEEASKWFGKVQPMLVELANDAFRKRESPMSVMSWLLERDPAIRWQVMRDLMNEPIEVVAAERARRLRGVGRQGPRTSDPGRPLGSTYCGD